MSDKQELASQRSLSKNACQDATKDQTHSIFFCLPVEVRLLVYEHLAAPEAEFIVAADMRYSHHTDPPQFSFRVDRGSAAFDDDDEDNHMGLFRPDTKKPRLSILSTCQAIYNEALPTFTKNFILKPYITLSWKSLMNDADNTRKVLDILSKDTTSLPGAPAICKRMRVRLAFAGCIRSYGHIEDERLKSCFQAVYRLLSSFRKSYEIEGLEQLVINHESCPWCEDAYDFKILLEEFFSLTGFNNVPKIKVMDRIDSENSAKNVTATQELETYMRSIGPTSTKKGGQ